MNYAAAAAIPLFTAAVVLAGLLRRCDIFADFTAGAMDSLKTIARLVPTLVALLVAVELLTASGAVDLLVALTAPIGRILGVPPELMPLVALRPLSGSGSISVLQNLISTHGADSYIATAGAVILTSTETTVYTIGVYYGSVGERGGGPVLPAALLADLAAVVGGCFFVRLFLY